MSRRGVLFDLDGTLIDSAPDLTDAINELLAASDRPPHPEDAVRRMIGHGIAKLVERAFAAHSVALDAPALEDRTQAMMAIYGSCLTRRTTLMPGARAALERIKARGLGTAVVTNKPGGFTETILRDLGLASFVDAGVGGDSGLPRKPAPDMLIAACDAIGRVPADVWMIGDSAADVEAARAASIRCLLVRGGYTDADVETLGADQVIASLDDLDPDRIGA